MNYNDNLTDLVEHLEDNNGKNEENPANKAFEVENDKGEVIKLNDK